MNIQKNMILEIGMVCPETIEPDCINGQSKKYSDSGFSISHSLGIARWKHELG